jgi:2-phosphoglycerate kinase
MGDRRRWQGLPIGGAGGVGKTHVGYRLARPSGVGIAEVGDFRVIPDRTTTPEQQPALHSFRTDPGAFCRPDGDEKPASASRYAEETAAALEHVIADHLAGGAPIVPGGGFLLPSLAARSAYDGVPAAGRVRALVVCAADADQLGRDHAARGGEPRPGRARAGWRHRERLRREAGRLGVPTPAARPWETVFARALTLLAQPP